MEIDKIVVGAWQANCYAVRSGDEVLVIDPGDEPERILAWLGDANVTQILITHGHCDHFGAVNELVEAYGAKVLIGRLDEQGLTDLHFSGFDAEGRDYRVTHVDRLLDEGDTIEWGSAKLDVIHTPGHTPGSMCFIEEGERFMFAGDTLFPNGVGRTDFPYGDAMAMRETCLRLGTLADDLVVLPGHGAHTVLGVEKRRNRLLGCI